MDEFSDLKAAAEGGDARAMNRLGSRLDDVGDRAGAEAWYRRAADAGESDAMYNLGILFEELGDRLRAAEWYRRAADAGDTDAMYHLGYSALQAGDLEDAATWYRRAAEAGDLNGMSGLAYVLDEQGDLEASEHWYREAAEAGDTSSMHNLAIRLRNGGDLAGAQGWFRQAAEAGNVESMNGLAYVLYTTGESEEARHWWRRAADAGHASSMNSLGIEFQLENKLDEASSWFERAAAAGYEQAAVSLAELSKKAETDPMLDAVLFDTFSWKMTENGAGSRRWGSTGVSLSERFIDVPPPSEVFDVEAVQSAMLELTEKPAAHLEGVEIPEEWQRFMPTDFPEELTLLELESFAILPAQCLYTLNRHRSGGHVHYSGAVTLGFAKCFWVLGVEVEEEELVGAREGAVARKILENNESARIGTKGFDPYERRWDGLIPVEDDPLTRVRLLIDRLRQSIRLGAAVRELQPITRSGS